jgi:hypothetical protein
MRYAKLCTLVLQHDYFKDTEIKRLSVEPTTQTKFFMRNLNLIHRGLDNGFTLGCLEKDKKKLRTLRKGEKLTFLVTTTDGYFDNFTNYPVRKMNEISYLTTKNGTSLSKKETVSIEDRMVCFPNKFVYNFSDFNDNKTVLIKNNNVEVVSELPKQARTPINLANEEEGRFSIHEGESEVQVFYTLQHIPRGLIAVIDIFIEDLLSEEERQYAVFFESRKVIWAYYFVNYKDNVVYEKLSIEPLRKGDKVPFSTPEIVTIHTGQSAIKIVSEKPIKVQENAENRFQLKALKKNTQERTTLQLPIPSFKEIVVDKESRQLIAKMFLKI